MSKPQDNDPPIRSEGTVPKCSRPPPSRVSLKAQPAAPPFNPVPLGMMLSLVMAAVAAVMVVMAIMFAVAAVKVDDLNDKLDESRRTAVRTEPAPPPPPVIVKDDSRMEGLLLEFEGRLAEERRAHVAEMERLRARTAELEAGQSQLRDSLARPPVEDLRPEPEVKPALPTPVPAEAVEPVAGGPVPLSPKALEAARSQIESQISLAEGKKKAGDLDGALALLKQAETAADTGGAHQCAACAGEGGSPCVPTVSPCARCTGVGRIPSPVRLADGAPTPDIDCFDCGGKGDEGRCPKCTGRGRIGCGKCGSTGNPHHDLMARIDTRLEEVERALQWINCETCKGTKVCTPCKGEGTHKCAECEGKGKTVMRVSCTRCAGTKSTSCQKLQNVSCAGCKEGVVLCKSCGGSASVRCDACSGTAINRGGLRCTACSATGAKACTACAGKGGKPCATCSGKTQPCAKCAGSGKRKCDKCSGEGGSGLMRDCSKCRSGLTSCPACSGTTKCAACKGRGRVKSTKIPGLETRPVTPTGR